ncbi:MAG: nucleotidyltransferase domain-containing protein [Methylocystis silviterrae]|uniref:GSU2403 family nucleotidyltransferase fold protein n=1 Tax=Methylocystis silviterrae TaxID=2743612 RepID=UPI003C7099FC
MQDFNNDQRREMVNTRQRFEAWRAAALRLVDYRGSMVWSPTKGIDYLLRSSYDRTSAQRRQHSLGARSPETERQKAEFDRGRDQARSRFEAARDALTRQAAINRVLGLGRMPLLGAKIVRALDDAGLLGHGVRIIGTNAIYAYEAAAGVFIDPSLTTTEDIDLLFDSRATLRVMAREGLANEDVAERGLIGLLKRIDRSFEQTAEKFRAVNDEGYLVDLVKPLRAPPWASDRAEISTQENDLSAVEIEGLIWLENAQSFEAVAIDERGGPVRIVTIDPRVFAAHKWWLSHQPSRDPVKRRRDEAQARAVGRLAVGHLEHLAYRKNDLEMLPKAIFDAAAPLFAATHST